jgi:hypothetical protein
MQYLKKQAKVITFNIRINYELLQQRKTGSQELSVHVTHCA